MTKTLPQPTTGSGTASKNSDTPAKNSGTLTKKMQRADRNLTPDILVAQLKTTSWWTPALTYALAAIIGAGLCGAVFSATAWAWFAAVCCAWAIVDLVQRSVTLTYGLIAISVLAALVSGRAEDHLWFIAGAATCLVVVLRTSAYIRLLDRSTRIETQLLSAELIRIGMLSVGTWLLTLLAQVMLHTTLIQDALQDAQLRQRVGLGLAVVAVVLVIALLILGLRRTEPQKSEPRNNEHSSAESRTARPGKTEPKKAGPTK